MGYIFICKKCGNIQKYINDNGAKELECENCFNEIGWESSFSPLTALNFKNSASLLLEQAKKQDKENLERNNYIKFHLPTVPYTAFKILPTVLCTTHVDTCLLILLKESIITASFI